MRNTVSGVGMAGIIYDTKPQDLPYNYWSDGRNVRFDRNKCYGMGGVVKGLTSPVTDLLNVGIVSSPSTNFVLYTIGTRVYSYDGTTVNDITRAAGTYLESADNLFDIFSFNGLGLLNTPVEIPQLWDPSNGANLLVNLTNWDVNWKTNKLRKFKSFLMALGMTESAVSYPHKLRWSSPAEAGAIPASWDDTDPTQLAGSFSFPDTTYGKLVDGLELNDRFYVYKEGSIWVMDFVGGNDVLSRDPVVANVGLSIPRSLVHIPNRKGSQPAHFFAGDDNFYIMDGNTVIPVFEEIFTDEFIKLRDADNYVNRSFSVVSPKFNEVWFCFPESGSEYATLAFCMNYVNETYCVRELSGATSIVSGFGFDFSVDLPEDVLFSDDTTYNDGTGFSGVVTGGQASTSVLIEASPVQDNYFYLDVGAKDYDETPFVRYVQRESLATVQADPRRPETLRVDYNSRKICNSFTPKFFPGTSAEVCMGVQEHEEDAITWTTPVVVTSTQHLEYLSTPISGRFISIKLASIGEDDFAFSGFDYNIQVLGEF